MDYNTVNGWIAPPAQVINVAANNTSVVSGTFSPEATSINEIDGSGFSIYPNPVSDYLNITSNNNEKITLTIFNSIGEKIYTAVSIGSAQIQTSDFPHGIYFLQLRSSGNAFTEKLILE